MLKNIAFYMFLTIIVVACSNDKADNKNNETNEKVYTVEDLMSNDFEYKDGLITVKGLCVHICEHSGKKLFIVGNNPDNKLIIMSSDEIPVFDKKYEGNTLEISGTLEEERIDMNYLTEWEKELAEAKEIDEEACQFETNMKKINDYKERLANSKKGYVSYYSMIGKKIKSI